MSNENEAKLFAELTAHEQQVVQSGTGWDGEAYTDKDGLRIELVAVDGEDTRYRVFHPQPVPQDEPAEETPAEVPATEPEAPAAEPAANGRNHNTRNRLRRIPRMG